MLIEPKWAWHWPCLFILWCDRWWIWVSHRPQCLCSPLNVIRSFSGFWNCLISTLVRMPYSNLGLCFFRLHRMWLIATDVTCSMIFVSVCLSVCSSHVLLHKNGWNSRDAILGADWWMWGQGTMYYIIWVQDQANPFSLQRQGWRDSNASFCQITLDIQTENNVAGAKFYCWWQLPLSY